MGQRDVHKTKNKNKKQGTYVALSLGTRAGGNVAVGNLRALVKGTENTMSTAVTFRILTRTGT